MTITQMTVLGFFLIFAGTTLGSALVYFTKNKISPKVNTLLLGFAGGVMIAASVWSLIIPSLNQSEAQGGWGKWFFCSNCGGVYCWWTVLGATGQGCTTYAR